jgi:hypothetical protein
MTQRKDPTLELKRVFAIDVDELLSAREKCFAVHHTDNIYAAGHEVEESVRRVLTRRLPKDCYVGHGHIVDSKGAVSSQLDIIISADGDFPKLFDTASGASFYTYESVYAIGEVKSTYVRRQRPIHAFVKAIRRAKALYREDVDDTFVHTGRGHGINLTSRPRIHLNHPLNELFTFMMIINSGDFKVSDVSDLYKTTSLTCLPSVVCLLDRGLILYQKRLDKSDPLAPIVSEPHPERMIGSMDHHWVIQPIARTGETDVKTGNYAYFWSMLADHLKECVLKGAGYLAYTSSMLVADDEKIEPIF